MVKSARELFEEAMRLDPKERAGLVRLLIEALDAEIDDGVEILAASVDQGVGEDQAPLGVGVEDLDGLAVHRFDDVAGLERVGPRHIVGEGAKAVHLGAGL